MRLPKPGSKTEQRERKQTAKVRGKACTSAIGRTTTSRYKEQQQSRERRRSDTGQKAETSIDRTTARTQTHIESGTRELEQAVSQHLSAKGTGIRSRPGVWQLREQQAPTASSHKCWGSCYKCKASMPGQSGNESSPSDETRFKHGSIDHETRRSQQKEHQASKEEVEEMLRQDKEATQQAK